VAAMMSSTSIRQVTAEAFTCARTGRRPLFTIYTCYACLVLYTMFGADTRTLGRRGAGVVVGGLLSVWRRGGRARAFTACAVAGEMRARPRSLAFETEASTHAARRATADSPRCSPTDSPRGPTSATDIIKRSIGCILYIPITICRKYVGLRRRNERSRKPNGAPKTVADDSPFGPRKYIFNSYSCTAAAAAVQKTMRCERGRTARGSAT